MVDNNLNSKVENHEVEVTDSVTGAENANKNLEPMIEVETEGVTGGAVRTKISNSFFKKPGTGDIHMTCPYCGEKIVLDSKKLGLADGNQSSRRQCPKCNKYFNYNYTFVHHYFRPNTVAGEATDINTTPNNRPIWGPFNKI